MASSLASIADVRRLVRHQAAAFAATCVDFTAMIALVELAGVRPGIATFLSAAAGGATNFVITRIWAFRSLHTGSIHGQATRYALASAGGALLNAVLLELALAIVALPYVLLRVVVSFLVGVLYTYPVHSMFVFRLSPRSTRGSKAVPRPLDAADLPAAERAR
jgi:putative flippase GtrA